MARLVIADQEQAITDHGAIRSAMQDIGVIFSHWSIDRLPADLREERHLDEDEKGAVLAAYRAETDRLCAEGGYQTADVVSLYPDTPQLDELCAKFDKPHIHSEDEVRFVVQGRGIFTLFPEGGASHAIELHPGDFITVPAGVIHYFELCEDRRITCIRLFTDPAGWVAQYTEPSQRIC